MWPGEMGGVCFMTPSDFLKSSSRFTNAPCCSCSFWTGQCSTGGRCDTEVLGLYENCVIVW